jgi:septal ring factor EnvC (AmiA/AmiB activator)
VTDEPGSNNFDEVARTLSDGLSSQLASLRSIVVEAESRREADRVERERLESAVSERDETIRSMQQQLREFADSLERNPSF